MAEAEPTSAWQPPSAPEREASFSITRPIPPAVKNARTRASSLAPFSAATVNRTAGSTPQAPAVGAATIRPMQALTSATERAAATSRVKAGASREPPWSSQALSWWAPPRIRPLRECWGWARPRARAWRMTSMRARMNASRAAGAWPEAWASSSRNTRARGTPWAPAAAR